MQIGGNYKNCHDALVALWGNIKFWDKIYTPEVFLLKMFISEKSEQKLYKEVTSVPSLI